MLKASEHDELVNHIAPHIYRGRVVRVVDGDTLGITLGCEVPNSGIPFRMGLTIRLRVKDIDSCETHRPSCLGELELGKKATDMIKVLAEGRQCYVRTFKKSFDRFVGDILIDVDGTIVDIRTYLIENHLQKADLNCRECARYRECRNKLKNSFPNRKHKRQVIVE